MQRRIEKINEKISPFYIMRFWNGKYGLSLDADGGYRQEVFDKWASLNNKPITDSAGFLNFGNGYDWENIFKLCVKETLGIVETDPLLTYDSEAGLFGVYSEDIELLERVSIQFSALVADETKFFHYVKEVLDGDDRYLEGEENLDPSEGSSIEKEEGVHVLELPKKQQDIIRKALQKQGIVSYDLERAMHGLVSDVKDIIPVEQLLKRKDKELER